MTGIFFPTAPAPAAFSFGGELQGTLEYALNPPLPPPRAKVIEMPKPAAEASPYVPEILSPSTVNQFLDCSARWYYRKVLRLPETGTADLALGSAVDEAITENFRQKIHTGADLPIAEVVRIYAAAMIREFDERRIAPDPSHSDLADCGQAMLSAYMSQAAPSIKPADVQVPVDGAIGGIRVQGYVDILDVNGVVIENKTSKRKPSAIRPAHRLQATTYEMLSPGATGRAQVTTITKTKTVSICRHTFEVGPADRLYAERIYSIVRDQMATGLIAPNRDSFFCSRKNCSYVDRCCGDFGGQVA